MKPIISAIIFSAALIFSSGSALAASLRGNEREVQETTKSDAVTSRRRSVLILRVIVNGESPTVSKSDLHTFAFTHENSLKNQMHRCSHGNVILVPSKYGGVIDVPINISDNTKSTSHVYSTAQNAAIQLIDPSLSNIRHAAHHFAVVVPANDADSGFIGWGEIGSGGSAFNDDWGTSLSLLMHEFGHNLGLPHASFEKEYADSSGYMGWSHRQQGAPLKCYNAANHWSLGWYKNKRRDIYPSNPPVRVKVVAFVDHRKATQQDTVLVKVGNLYMQFNRAKSFNADTGILKDNLVVVREYNPYGGKRTSIVAGLNMTNRFYRDWNTVIEVCNIGQRRNGVDFVDISIGKSRTDCSSNPQSTPKGRTHPTTPHVSVSESRPTSKFSTKVTWSNPFNFLWKNGNATSSPILADDDDVDDNHQPNHYALPSSSNNIESSTNEQPMSDSKELAFGNETERIDS